jgi:chromosome segregation ATPase
MKALNKKLLVVALSVMSAVSAYASERTVSQVKAELREKVSQLRDCELKVAFDLSFSNNLDKDTLEAISSLSKELIDLYKHDDELNSRIQVLQASVRELNQEFEAGIDEVRTLINDLPKKRNFLGLLLPDLNSDDFRDLIKRGKEILASLGDKQRTVVSLSEDIEAHLPQ